MKAVNLKQSFFNSTFNSFHKLRFSVWAIFGLQEVKVTVIFSLFVFNISPELHAQESHVISRKEVSASPSEYPNGVYIMDSESEAPYSWPADAGVIFGIKPAHSLNRHIQFITDYQGGTFSLRSKDGSLDTWRSWRSIMVANEIGNLGIGTTNAPDRLTVMAGGNQGSVGLFGATGTGDAGIYFDASDGDFTGLGYGSLLQFDDLSIKLNKHGPNPLIFNTNSTDRLTIAGDGNVGIGTTIPQQKLHVKSNIRFEREVGGPNCGRGRGES